MSERKVLNKYFPPDFDPSKIKRSKIPRDPQMVIRLMSPFSMRCNRCGEYIYKGKKFNARKETAVGEDYFGIKIFRFYIKCPTCSSEITFKTDPKAADYTMEHGAKRNFENWVDSDPTGKAGYIPDAAADDDLDSDGNVKESAAERDAMADLERSQEASRLEMERMDELADLRQRNARVEKGLGTDPTSILDALHAERETAEEEERRKREQEEDDLLVRQVFSRLPLSTTVSVKDKGKGKAKEEERQDDGERDGAEDDEEENVKPEALTIKRKPAPGTGGASEPSVQSLLAAKGKSLDGPTTNGISNGINGAAQAQIKRKREGMQKLLGIKKKVKS